MLMAKKSVALNFTDEELKLFSKYSLERREPSFNLQALRQQKRHAEEMLSILRYNLYEAYLTGKECVSAREVKKRTGVALDTVNKRRRLAAQWLLMALGGVKEWAKDGLVVVCVQIVEAI